MHIRRTDHSETPLITRECVMVTCDKILIIIAVALATIGFLAWTRFPGLSALKDYSFYFVLGSLGSLLITSMFFKRPYCYETGRPNQNDSLKH